MNDVEPSTTLEGTMNIKGKYIALLGALLIVAAACGDSGSSDSSTAETAFEDGAAAATVAASSAVDSGGDLSAGAVEANATGLPRTSGGGDAAQGRDIIRTANLTVRVQNMPEAIAEVEAFAAARGGFVADENIELEEYPFAVITIRVPAGDFEQLLDDIGGIGELLVQEVSSRDVTAEVINLESRISTAEVSIDRLRGFLEEADDVSEITQLEAELARREAEAESMKAQLRGLNDRVALTTVTVSLSAEETPEVITAVADEAQLAGFQDGLSAGLTVLVSLATLLSALFGVLLPFLPFVMVALFVAWRLRKRSQRLSA
ncbi:MAG: DUF4349 domain-containing protein [Acidimicrobiales bacterium]